MKMGVSALLVSFVLLPEVAYADAIRIISQEYSVAGRADFDNFGVPSWAENRTESYQETASYPVYGIIDWSHPASWSDPSVPYDGYAFVETAAGGEITNTDAWIRVHSWLEDAAGAETVVWGFASASMTFSPHVSTMAATLDWGETSAYVELIDLTSGAYLLSGRASGLLPRTQELTLSLDPSHVYRMSMVTDSTFLPWQASDSSLTLRHVPDAGSTLLLLGIGLVGLRAERQWWR